MLHIQSNASMSAPGRALEKPSRSFGQGEIFPIGAPSEAIGPGYDRLFFWGNRAKNEQYNTACGYALQNAITLFISVPQTGCISRCKSSASQLFMFPSR
jgi:hypothetical protein